MSPFKSLKDDGADYLDIHLCFMSGHIEQSCFQYIDVEGPEVESQNHACLPQIGLIKAAGRNPPEK